MWTFDNYISLLPLPLPSTLAHLRSGLVSTCNLHQVLSEHKYTDVKLNYVSICMHI